jgi:formamidopyrimidine-DNA glycosylase
MPELPEVETIVRALSNGGRDGQPILGCTVLKPFLFWRRTLAEPDEPIFLERMVGQTVQAVQRRAKYIVVKFNINTLLIHLRMSGDLRVESMWNENGANLLPHDRLALSFENDLALIFNDPRKFGRVWLTAYPDKVLGGLGPEPLENDLTPRYFYELLHQRQRQLKPLLMDQRFLAGLGNIYTDEALFRARLHPLLISNEVTEKQAQDLLAAIRDVLNEGINRNGASIDWVYRGGDFQNTFNVYQRHGEACYVCGSVIQRAVIGQRGSHFCPNCQQKF